MDFIALINAIRSGITGMMRNSADGVNLNADFWGYEDQQYMIESIFNSGIISGLSNPEQPVTTIYCAEHDHEQIRVLNPDIAVENSFEGNASRFMFNKKPDICIRDDEQFDEGWPNWFIQVKKGVDSHIKAAQALGDYLWGFIDKSYLSHNGIEDLNYAFVWFETVEKRKVDRWLHFEVPDFPEDGTIEDLQEMTLEYSPGYHLDFGLPGISSSLGNIRFKACNSAGATPWIDREDCILRPNSYSVIKQMLGTGTNSSYVRMFRQGGTLRLSSQFAQFIVDETLCVYIHLLNPDYELTDVNVNADNSPFGDPLFGWLP